MSITCTVLDEMRHANAFVFRRAKVNHVVVTMASRVRRKGKSHTLCGKRVDDTFQRRVPMAEGIAAPVTCESCLNSMTALMTLIEAHEARLEEPA